MTKNLFAYNHGTNLKQALKLARREERFIKYRIIDLEFKWILEDHDIDALVQRQDYLDQAWVTVFRLLLGKLLEKV
jgi:hypothetical protein